MRLKTLLLSLTIFKKWLLSEFPNDIIARGLAPAEINNPAKGIRSNKVKAKKFYLLDSILKHSNYHLGLMLIILLSYIHFH